MSTSSDTGNSSATTEKLRFETPEALSEAIAQSFGPEQALRTIRACLLAPLSTVSLTPTEEHGSTDGPIVTPLFAAWRKAFKNLSDTAVDAVILDMSCGQAIEIIQAVNLVQHIATLLHVKSKGRITVSIAGCEDTKRVWLEKCLP